MSNAPIRIMPVTISRSMLIALLLCFFMPFITVSCAGADVTVSGVNLVAGGVPTVSDGRVSVPADEPVEPSPLMIGAFLLAATGLGLTFVKGLGQRALLWTLAACGALGALIFLVFKLALDSQVPPGQGIVLTYNLGYWVAWLLFALVAGFHGWQTLRGPLGATSVAVPVALGELRLPDQISAILPGPTKRPCPACGKLISGEALFCMHCGALPGQPLAAPTTQRES